MAKRHPTFYFDERLVVLQVEDTLFKVHKYHLLQSETFSDMFSVTSAPGELAEGATPERPIVLNGVSASDFEALLTVLYAYARIQPELTPSLLVSAFRLAHMWNFPDLRAYLLLRAAEILDDIGKIEFANEFNIKEWLLPAYMNLCRRSKSPTIDEATRLGVHGLLVGFRLREHYRPWDPTRSSKIGSSDSQKYCDSCFGYSYHRGIGFTFGLGLKNSKPPDLCTCTNYGNETRTWYHRTHTSTSDDTDDTLKNRLTRWIEEGCQSE
ncbi:hypothetical protein B0J17DRAFT_628633 [Rhizoctonia solani]|nr:hypothetical protein B0J17DRAFT_628633 [Rhizoctonia solani]